MRDAKVAPNLASFHRSDSLLLDPQLGDDRRMMRDSAHACALNLGRGQTDLQAFF
jgi:hypothetical protein